MKQLLSSIIQKLPLPWLPIAPCLIMLLVLKTGVIVQWLPNNEPDVAGYRVYYGNASRSYGTVFNAGLTTSYKIDNLQTGLEYFFAVSAYDTAGNESPLSDEVSILLAENGDILEFNGNKDAYNFPNPFNPDREFTQLRYFLKKSDHVTVEIFDVTGAKVRTLLKQKLKLAGEHIEDVWDGRDEHGQLLPNGIYYARIRSELLNQYVAIAVMK